MRRPVFVEALTESCAAFCPATRRQASGIVNAAATLPCDSALYSHVKLKPTPHERLICRGQRSPAAINFVHPRGQVRRLDGASRL